MSAEQAVSALRLVREASGQLSLTDAAGQTHSNVRLVPLFPASDPDNWISICEAAAGEIVCVADPGQLAQSSREVMRDELSRREFVPVIRRIVRVSSNTEPSEWDVETDRGRTRFVLETEENVRRLNRNQITIEDANGIRYLVADVAGLDAKSRRIVEWYV
jgi:uncharacterized protein DUF1854